MRTILRHKSMVFLALTIWLLASLTGAHGHLCFDGQEPPMSVHMDMLSDHIDHEEAEQHQDVDVNLGELTLSKLIKIGFPLIITVLFIAVMLQITSVFHSRYLLRTPSRLAGIRPPLRAPPTHPA